MAECNVTGFPCKDYSYTTGTEGICLNLKWTVKNFHHLPSLKDYKFPPVRPTPQCDLEVSFRKESQTLFIFIGNKLKSDIYLNATTVIYGQGDKQLYVEVVPKQSLLNKKISILPKLKNRSILPNFLLIEIKLGLSNLSSENLVTAAQENEMALLEDMKNFILAEHPSEVILKTKDAEIPANRAILRARSSVFQKMFDHPTSEQEENVVHVDDVTGTVLKTLVDFLYSGKAELPKSDLPSLQELYYASDKYDVQGLRKMCAQAIVSMLKKENVIGVLLLADRHSDDHLKNRCLLFIRSCMEPLMGTESWANLKVSDPGLAFEVLETCCKGSAALQQKSK